MWSNYLREMEMTSQWSSQKAYVSLLTWKDIYVFQAFDTCVGNTSFLSLYLLILLSDHIRLGCFSWYGNKHTCTYLCFICGSPHLPSGTELDVYISMAIIAIDNWTWNTNGPSLHFCHSCMNIFHFMTKTKCVWA